MDYLLDQKILVEQDKKLRIGPGYVDVAAREKLIAEIRGFLPRSA